MIAFYKEPVILENFITNEECEYLVNYDLILKETRFAADPTNTEKAINSFYKKIPKHDIIIKNIINKCSSIVKLSYDNFEDFTVIKYDTGGFISEHQDSTPGENYRLYTFILCLTDSFEGGETYFTNLNKCFKLKKCDALFFNNVDSNGYKTKLAEHEGKIVKSGEKWICNVWIKKHPLRGLST